MVTTSGFGKGILRIYGFLSLLITLASLTLTIIIFANLIPNFTNELYLSSGLNREEFPIWGVGLIFSFSTLFSAIETWLLFRAAANPKKSFFLFILSLLGLAGSIVAITTSEITWSPQNIISLIWSITLVLALFIARSGRR